MATYQEIPGIAPLEAQRASNWCWAAVTALLVRWHKSEAWTQEKIVEKFLGTQEDRTMALADVLRTLRQEATLPRFLISDAVTINEDPAGALLRVRGRLAAGLPVPITISWQQRIENHYVCAIGHPDDPADGSILIYDPAQGRPGQRVEASLAKLQSFPGEEGAGALTGKWTQIFLPAIEA